MHTYICMENLCIMKNLRKSGNKVIVGLIFINCGKSLEIKNWKCVLCLLYLYTKYILTTLYGAKSRVFKSHNMQNKHSDYWVKMYWFTFSTLADSCWLLNPIDDILVSSIGNEF